MHTTSTTANTDRPALLFPVVCLLLLVGTTAAAYADEKPWRRHTIDNTSRGADGVRLADVNGDGRMDIATGWEEGGVIRVYVNPGAAKSRQPWPQVTVGRVRSAEDAVLVDLDGDRALDVVSSCEGRTRTMYVHWAPKNPADFLDAEKWTTQPIPATAEKQPWMFCLPLAVDRQRHVDLITGSKSGSAAIGWLELPKVPRQLESWKWHSIVRAGWIMSLTSVDLDGDGDLDVVASDRKGKSRGVLWLERLAATKPERWRVHRVGSHEHEVMFLDVADLDGDQHLDIVAMTIAHGIRCFRRQPGSPVRFEEHAIDAPTGTGRGKGVRVVDVDLDGRLDLLVSCETSTPPKAGLVWMSYKNSPRERTWTTHPLSGPEGVKFDLVQLLDLDDDGDLDAITCEERANLGVIWYENPARQPRGE